MRFKRPKQSTSTSLNLEYTNILDQTISELGLDPKQVIAVGSFAVYCHGLKLPQKVKGQERPGDIDLLCSEKVMDSLFSENKTPNGHPLQEVIYKNSFNLLITPGVGLLGGFAVDYLRSDKKISKIEHSLTPGDSRIMSIRGILDELRNRPDDRARADEAAILKALDIRSES